MKSSKMRGGKWKRGGRPYIAVVVFDPDPLPPTKQGSTAHPFVFNSRQFIKTTLRDNFAKETGARLKDNPIHSTDNEAEAIGHFPLFFSPQEQHEIFTKVNELRRLLSNKCLASPESA